MANTTIQPDAEAAVDAIPHRITAARFERMIEASILDGPERLFLWEGNLYERKTPSWPHSYAVTALRIVFHRIVPEASWCCLQTTAIVVGDISMPEPDITVIRGKLRDFLDRRPTTQETSLIVEVADCSLAFDLGAKLRAYATHGVPIYWVVDILGKQIIVHFAPTGATYAEAVRYNPGDLVPVILDDCEIGQVAVDDILI